MIEEITIKLSTKLEPTQASWKSQLYNYNLKLQNILHHLNLIILLNNVMLYSCIEIILMYDYNNVILRCNVTS